jgi:hypothetical protein
MRLLGGVLGALVILGPCADVCGAQHPAQFEVTVGAGGAVAAEKDIFNLPIDHASTPDVVFLAAFRRQDSRGIATGVHFYGATEQTPPYAVSTPGGLSLTGTVRLSTFNLGCDVRYAFLSGPLMPYAYAGMSGIVGTANGGEIGSKALYGFSAVCGPGIRCQVSSTAVGLEGLFSWGWATWSSEPFDNSRRAPFDPSLAALVAHVTFIWR